MTGFDNGAKVFDPNIPSFLNTLSKVTDGFGYWVRVNQADVLEVAGTCIAENFRKPFDAGWNLVAYPKEDPEAPSVYFSDLIADNNLEFVTGFENGAKLFDPNIPPFLNTLTAMENGFGYWTRVSNAISGKTEEGINQSNIFNFINGRTNLPDGETVLIQTKAGNTVGKMEVNHDGYLMTTAVYGDDLSTEVVEGIAMGTPLVFVWQDETIDLGTIFKGDLSIEKIVLDFNKTTKSTSQNQGVKIYPNPTNDVLTFEFYLMQKSDLEIRIFNTEGKLVKIEQSKDLKAGHHHSGTEN